jgi:hypothetical protein
MLNGKFLRISYKFFDNTDVDNLFTRVGTKGFFIYSYLLYQQGNKGTCEVSMKMIQTFLNKDYDNRPTIQYRKNKECKIELIKEPRTIAKYIQLLADNKLIKIHNQYKRINDVIIITCNTFNDDLFIPMPEQLFIDKIYKTGHIGWSLLCLFTKLFNKEYGSISCEGFCNPSQEYISSIIKTDVDTIRSYSYLLEKLKLIKILPQEKVYKCIDSKGTEVYEYLPNNYIVNHKLQENKYCIESYDSEKINHH